MTTHVGKATVEKIPFHSHDRLVKYSYVLLSEVDF